ncbi:MAG: AAA family ATPase [Gallionella sp.]|nr:AAA family ATPase [Gallionella sp.]
MKTILVANPKGGSGKSTLSVNVAGFLAQRGDHVAMLDLDRQQSSALWLGMRDIQLPLIDLLGDKKPDDGYDWLVIDSPAGLHGKNLAHALKLASKIIVPIAPSLFDLDASRTFLEELAREKAVRKNHCHIGIIGMRMSPRTKAAQALEHFLTTFDLPILAYLRETQVYVNAAFEGKSLFDLPAHLAERELEQWGFLQDWLAQE